MATSRSAIRAVMMAGLMAAAAATALAQAPADFFVKLDGQKRVVTITRADGNSLYYRETAGEVPQPWRTIKDWYLAERPTVKPALAAIEAGKCAEAVAALKPIVDAYIILPVGKVPWVGDAVVGLIRAYTELKQFPAADAVSKIFAQTNPGEINRVKAFLAVALAGQGKHDEAIGLLKEVAKIGEGKLAVTPQEGRTLGQAYLSLGDCYAGKGDLQKALDSYLTTVVLYYHDEAVTRQAQAKADELKKKLRPTETKPNS